MKRFHAISIVIAVNVAITLVQLRNAVFAGPLSLKWPLLDFCVFLVPYSIMHVAISCVISQSIFGALILLFRKNKESIEKALEDILQPAIVIAVVFSVVFALLNAVGVV